MDMDTFLIFVSERQLLLPDKLVEGQAALLLQAIHFTMTQMEPTDYATSETLLYKNNLFIGSPITRLNKKIFMRTKAEFQKTFKKCLLMMIGSECLNILKSSHSLCCFNVLPCMLLLPF